MRRYTGSILTLLALCWSAASFAVTLSGVVTDEVDELDQVEVLLVDQKSGVVVNRYYTDGTGAYHFTTKSGTYKLGVSRDAYLTRWVKGVTVVKSDVVLDVELMLAIFTEESGEAGVDECE